MALDHLARQVLRGVGDDGDAGHGAGAYLPGGWSPSCSHRCRTPTNRLCPCGRVARELARRGIETEERRVAWRRGDRDEVEELTGQAVVPVLVLDGDAICDSAADRRAPALARRAMSGNAPALSMSRGRGVGRVNRGDTGAATKPEVPMKYLRDDLHRRVRPREADARAARLGRGGATSADRGGPSRPASSSPARGCSPTTTATTVRVRDGERAAHRRPVRGDARAARRLLPGRGRGPRRGDRAGPRKIPERHAPARIEVRP